MKPLLGSNHIKDGDVGAGLGQTARKCQAASAGTPGDKGRSALERKLILSRMPLLLGAINSRETW